MPISKPSVQSRIRRRLDKGGQAFDVRRIGKKIEGAERLQAVSSVEQPARITRQRGGIAGDVDDTMGRPANDGVGGFLWQQYNALVYEQIILCILTIGLVGFVLDRLMSVVERRFKTA